MSFFSNSQKLDAKFDEKLEAIRSEVHVFKTQYPRIPHCRNFINKGMSVHKATDGGADIIYPFYYNFAMQYAAIAHLLDNNNLTNLGKVRKLDAALESGTIRYKGGRTLFLNPIVIKEIKTLYNREFI
jgi:hypothetical protein